jgi:O-antigen/teichoic acid export membrane protein
MGDAITYLGQLALIVWFVGNESAKQETAVFLMGISACAGIVAVLPFLPRLRTTRTAFFGWLRRSWRTSRWLSLSEILEWMASYSYFAIAALFLGASAVGALRAAQNIMALSNVFIFGLENILPVRASRVFVDQGIAGLDRFIVKVRYLVLGIVLTVFTVASVASNFWLSLLYGEEYGGYGYVVVGVGLASILVAMGVPLRIWMQTMERTRPVFHSYLISLAVVAVFVMPSTWLLGLPGLLLGIIVCATVALAVMWRGVSRVRRTIRDAEAGK